MHIGKFIKRVGRILKPLFTTCRVRMENDIFTCIRSDGTEALRFDLNTSEEGIVIQKLMSELKRRENMIAVRLDDGRDVYAFKKVSSRRLVVLDNGVTVVVTLKNAVDVGDKDRLDLQVRDAYSESSVIKSSRSKLEV